MLKIEFETDNAAFRDPDTGEESDFDKSIECQILLHNIINRLDYGVRSGEILDTNGNRVGTWSLD